jgi:hypothetical protein
VLDPAVRRAWRGCRSPDGDRRHQADRLSRHQGYDRAVMLVPSWVMVLVWLIGHG